MRVSFALTEIGGGLENYIRTEREREGGENRRPSPVDANGASWHVQTIRADVVGVGEVPPHFMNTCSDGESAREGEQDRRDSSSHCQKGRGDQKHGKVAWEPYL